VCFENQLRWRPLQTANTRADLQNLLKFRNNIKHEHSSIIAFKKYCRGRQYELGSFVYIVEKIFEK
jgi:hypothetical protein